MDVTLRFNLVGGAEAARTIGTVRDQVRSLAQEAKREADSARDTARSKRADANDAARAARVAANEVVAAERRADAEARKSARDRAAEAKKLARDKADEAKKAAAAEESAAKKSADAQRKLEAVTMRERIRSTITLGETRDKVEKQYQSEIARTTQVIEKETGRRVAAGSSEAKQIALLARQSVDQRIRDEKRATKATEEEADRRAKKVIDSARAVGGVLGAAAQTFHSNAQDDRHTRASSDRTLNSAFFQAGIRGNEVLSSRKQLFDFAQKAGMDEGELSAAISASQTETSFLTGKNEEERKANLKDALDAAMLARNTYQNPNEVMRVSGVLGQMGIKGNDRNELIKVLIAESMGGAIELGDVSKQALGPMVANIAARTSGLTGEERSAAMIAEFKRSMGVAEVARAAGQTPRDSLNAFAKLQRSMSDAVMTNNLYERLHARKKDGKSLTDELFTTTKDDRGYTVHSLKNSDPTVLLKRLSEVYKPSELLNMLHGGDGDPMILDAQVRRLVGTLVAGDKGATGLDKVAEFQRMGLSQEEIAAGGAMRESEFLTTTTRDAITRRNASDINLNQTPSFARDASVISNSAADFARQNPIKTSIGLGTLGLIGTNPLGLATEVIGGLGVLGGTGITAGLDAIQERVTGRSRGNVDPINLLNLRTWKELGTTPDSVLSASEDSAALARASLGQQQRIMAQYDEASPEVQRNMLRGFASSGADPALAAQMIGREVAKALHDNPPEVKMNVFDFLHNLTDSSTAKPTP